MYDVDLSCSNLDIYEVNDEMYLTTKKQKQK